MKFPDDIERAALARVKTVTPQIHHSLDEVRNGTPLSAEPIQERLIARLQRKAQFSRGEAAMVARGMADPRPLSDLAARPEAIYGNTVDFVGVSFLERGFVSARAVARVAYRNGQPVGTGFMISDRLFLTNNHVIASEATADIAIEFDYELDPRNMLVGVTRFALEPETFFYTNERDDLDFTVIAVGGRVDGNKDLSSFGWCQLSDAEDKHALGECANIVQHPDGRYKEVVLRENRFVSRLDTVLHYVADTEPGSSGSPVFNNEWQVVALHHWGGPWRQRTDGSGRPVPLEVNEGIRATAIVRDLKARRSGMTAAQQVLLEQMLDEGVSLRPPRAVIGPATPANGTETTAPQMQPDGSATWRFPVEVSVRLPMWSRPAAAPPPGAAPAAAMRAAAASEASIKPSTNYNDRSGYKPAFISGHDLPLPRLGDKLKKDAAPNLQADSGDDEFELKYHHFSIVMNRKRQLAYFTACNIDGTKAKKVDRKTGKVTELTVGDVGHESLDSEGAEASENWFEDKRIAAGDQTNQALYDKQKVPGQPDPSSAARIARMLQRGHLVRRMDPAWGTDQQALVADADTFHFANCTPQLGFFNMGTAAKLNLEKSGGGQLWRALEDHVLRNAVAEKMRVSCFTGPIFKDKKDPKYRTIRVPMRFWKIVVWAKQGKLHSLAMIADQSPVLKAIAGLPEGFADAEALDELSRVKDFLATVRSVEKLTGLDFGNAIRAADIRGGEKLAEVSAVASLPVRSAKRARRKRQ
jgi:endonuclease G